MGTEEQEVRIQKRDRRYKKLNKRYMSYYSYAKVSLL
jgi:hypothetical protein